MKKLLLIIGIVQLGIFNVKSQTANKPGSGESLDFIGGNVNTGVNVGTNNLLNPGNGSFTMEAWIKIDSLVPYPSHWNPIMSKATDNGNFNNGYCFRVFSLGTATKAYLSCVVEDAGGNSASVSSSIPVIEKGIWYHVVSVLDRNLNTHTLYLNGVNIISSNVNLSSIINPTVPMHIAHFKQGATHQHFDGQIDEVRVWNIARTQTEVRESMCQKLQGSETGLAGYWRFDEGIDNSCVGGEDVCDATGNGNNGTKF